MRRLGVLLLLGLTACGGGYEPDMAALEADVAESIEDQAEFPVTVDCPDEIEWRVGDDFYCTAEAEDGSRSRITVSMQNDEGEYYWEVG